MNLSLHCQTLQRRINQTREENAETKKFVPERQLYEVLTRDGIAHAVAEVTPAHYQDEVVDFILQGARKVFGVLVLINYVGHINRFIKNDQFQTRKIDDLLPFSKTRLKEILDDDYISEMFFEKQWEFSVPVFSGHIMPRALARQTILPYMSDNHLTVGGYGVIRKIRIHPSHRPQEFADTAEFVRKELKEHDNASYENEVRVLATLQRLKHPNILRLVGCYTYNSSHNLISPFVAGGDLQKFLETPKSPDLSREEVFFSIAGLASAIWALHQFVLGDTEPSHKGNHQDLRPENILVDGNRFILADFGLSSIKSMSQASRTPFKGRKGYCQAPECAELRQPFQEHDTTRATDIFALACIILDVLVYLVRGNTGVQEFCDARMFEMSPMCYRLYHKENASNDSVAVWIEKVAFEDGSESIQEVVQLVGKMLRILPNERPKAATVAATLCLSTIKAFWESIAQIFARFATSPDALIERSRFLSWVKCQDIELYSSTSGPTTTFREFESTIDILRQMRDALQGIDQISPQIDCRSFSEVRTLNTQLLNMLSEERRSESRSRLESILLPKIGPGNSENIESTIREAFGNSVITQKAETKHLIALVEGCYQGKGSTMPPEITLARTVNGRIRITQEIGQYRIAEVRHKTKSMFVETIPYLEIARKRTLVPRIQALCDLLSNENINSQLRIPPFHGVHDDARTFSFEMLYNFPQQHNKGGSKILPISLHQLLLEGETAHFPPHESRLRLGLELAESLAAFHDVNWYHEDLTSFNILFFPTVDCPPPTRSSHLYMVGFRHSRSANDDFTEGPVRDPKHQRYHHPKYVCVENNNFTRFCPQFDHYSLGILLLEVGLWASIDKVMCAHSAEDNYTFSDILVHQKLPTLAFNMGSQYADIVRVCLTSWQRLSLDIHQKDLSSTVNLAFKEEVVIPLKKLDKQYSVTEASKKRKRREYSEKREHLSIKRKNE